MSFEEYARKIRTEKETQRIEKLNGALARGVRERTHEEAVYALYAGLTFVGGISDLVTTENAWIGKELVF